MTTKTMIKGMLAAAALTGAVQAAEVKAENAKSSIESASANFSVKSLYATNAAVVFNPHTVLHSSLSATVRGVTADVFSNYNPSRNLVDETDFTVSKTFSTNKLDVTPSLSYWTLPHTDFSDVKIASVAIASRNLPLGLQARVSAMKAWSNESHGHTADISLSKTQKLTDKLSATGSYTAALNHRFYNSETGFAAHNVGLNTAYKITDKLTLNAGVTRQIAAPSFKNASSQTIYSLGINLDLVAK